MVHILANIILHYLRSGGKYITAINKIKYTNECSNIPNIVGHPLTLAILLPNIDATCEYKTGLERKKKIKEEYILYFSFRPFDKGENNILKKVNIKNNIVTISNPLFVGQFF
jgi:hypothetical protein